MRTDRRQIVPGNDQRLDAKCFCVKPLSGTAPVPRERASYMARGATAADDDGVAASGPAAA